MCNPQKILKETFLKMLYLIFLYRLMCQANDKYQWDFQSKNTLDKGQKQRKYMSSTLGYEWVKSLW